MKIKHNHNSSLLTTTFLSAIPQIDCCMILSEGLRLLSCFSLWFAWICWMIIRDLLNLAITPGNQVRSSLTSTILLGVREETFSNHSVTCMTLVRMTMCQKTQQGQVHVSLKYMSFRKRKKKKKTLRSWFKNPGYSQLICRRMKPVNKTILYSGLMKSTVLPVMLA